MLTKGRLNIGDSVFVADEICNAFTKQKLKMVDANGVEWYRYDRDNWSYTVTEATFCGFVNVACVGEVNTDAENELHFKYSDGNIYCEYEKELYNVKDWFHTREEAESYIEKLKEARRE
jgi:hypothetical protein